MDATDYILMTRKMYARMQAFIDAQESYDFALRMFATSREMLVRNGAEIGQSD